jgi:hypothetical protein
MYYRQKARSFLKAGCRASLNAREPNIECGGRTECQLEISHLPSRGMFALCSDARSGQSVSFLGQRAARSQHLCGNNRACSIRHASLSFCRMMHLI